MLLIQDYLGIENVSSVISIYVFYQLFWSIAFLNPIMRVLALLRSRDSAVKLNSSIEVEGDVYLYDPFSDSFSFADWCKRVAWLRSLMFIYVVCAIEFIVYMVCALGAR